MLDKPRSQVEQQWASKVKRNLWYWYDTALEYLSYLKYFEYMNKLWSVAANFESEKLLQSTQQVKTSKPLAQRGFGGIPGRSRY